MCTDVGSTILQASEVALPFTLTNNSPFEVSYCVELANQGEVNASGLQPFDCVPTEALVAAGRCPSLLPSLPPSLPPSPLLPPSLLSSFPPSLASYLSRECQRTRQNRPPSRPPPIHTPCPRACGRACTHTNTHTFKYTQIHAFKDTHTFTYTHTHSHAHTHTHTFTRTHTNTLCVRCLPLLRELPPPCKHIAVHSHKSPHTHATHTYTPTHPYTLTHTGESKELALTLSADTSSLFYAASLRIVVPNQKEKMEWHVRGRCWPQAMFVSH